MVLSVSATGVGAVTNFTTTSTNTSTTVCVPVRYNDDPTFRYNRGANGT